nr:MAG TPA: hypothetical protein [Caudoviricetes sp.]
MMNFLMDIIIAMFTHQKLLLSHQSPYAMLTGILLKVSIILVYLHLVRADIWGFLLRVF